MPIPPVLRPVASHRGTDYYSLTTRPAVTELIPGLRTPVLTYGGSYVGPTIRARAGRRVVVRHRNGLEMPTSVHLHGGYVSADNDGHPMDLIQPGHTRTYSYDNRQAGATLWYHDHAHHMESEHVYRGLHGFYLIEEPAEARLRLPRGEYDVPIMLTDARIGTDGALVYQENDFGGRNTVLVNGRSQPYLRVAARRYRFRLLNASNLRFFQLTLPDGEQLTQIASDGGLLPAPVTIPAAVLSPGERAELVIDFARYPVGTQVLLQDVAAGPILRFDVVRPARDHSRVPETLRPVSPLPPATVEREIRLSTDTTTGAALIDGKTFDPDRVDITIRRGTSEIWRIVNLDSRFGIPHNLHLHLVQFRVLNRGDGPPLPWESGLKDTVIVVPGQPVTVQATFGGDHLGRYVYHCHMLDHSAAGMMAQFEVVP